MSIVSTGSSRISPRKDPSKVRIAFGGNVKVEDIDGLKRMPLGTSWRSVETSWMQSRSGSGRDT